ncbi:DeoR/GlpR family DNA-binding transcription regulator [Paenarthrobacter aurescens]|jgi:DeoR/GlpR family transcriptional regulator of sugar metabolism|uniref:Transcriptional regulator, DeoR family n=1 Tax=Paenarthrobacter aurescens (strain TC1) TaxID=290340 RepID=A1RC83_PAEAT|nr:DeoR/GlpR family DNA-binding transcription regulator [Paenarthrobacter aurescens]ABM07979.1 putative transcriptional regulator, DeoR family [Paenarthrobacter aurescens TC1]
MGTADRHRLIGELLRTREEATVDELVQATGASGATIRRDLEILAANGVLKRVHGGARSLLARGDNPGYGQRELEDHEAKVRIAQAVDPLIKDREHVWLDSGSTATEIARRLSHRALTVMPMSLHGVEALTRNKDGHAPELILPGGRLTPGEQSFRGPMTESNVRSLRFDTAVVTPCALNLKDGLLAHDLEDAAVKRAGLESAARVIVAASKSKWNASAVALVAAMDTVAVIVTDQEPSPEDLARLNKLSVEVVIA